MNDVYIRCPRCELNYIKKKDKLCSVCKAELAADHNDLDDMDLETCPICKTNFIRPDEIMCKSCLKERQLDDVVAEMSKEDEWDNYVDQDSDIDNPDEETGEMASIRDIDSADIDDLDIDDDSDLEDLDGVDFSDDIESEDFDEEEEEDEDEESDDDLDLDDDDE